MAALQKFNHFSEQLCLAKYKFDTYAFRLALTNTAPSATMTKWVSGAGGEVTSTANGYPSGGGVLAVGMSLTGATTKVTCADYTFTATGAWDPFRYGVIFCAEDPANKWVVGWFDHGASITLAAGETFKADFDAANGIFTLA